MGREGAKVQPVSGTGLPHLGRAVAKGMAVRGLGVDALAVELGCPVEGLADVLAGNRRIAPSLAAALGRAWGGVLAAAAS